VQQIRLSKGLFALVSDEDYEYLNRWKWCVSHGSRGTKWYAIRYVQRRKVRMSHQVAIRKYGPGRYAQAMLDKKIVDHVNHNSLDNRRQNIRFLTQRENMLAAPGWRRA
jgi:hypothetical protein